MEIFLIVSVHYVGGTSQLNCPYGFHVMIQSAPAAANETTMTRTAT